MRETSHAFIWENSYGKLLHREDGPAIKRNNGEDRWYYKSKPVTKNYVINLNLSK